MIRKSIAIAFAIFLRAGTASAQGSYSSPDTGETVLGTYFATDVDTINMKNGNLHVNIPLFTLPGRELPVAVSMDYNSQFYEYRVVYNPDPVGHQTVSLSRQDSVAMMSW